MCKRQRAGGIEGTFCLELLPGCKGILAPHQNYLPIPTRPCYLESQPLVFTKGTFWLSSLNISSFHLHGQHLIQHDMSRAPVDSRVFLYLSQLLRKYKHFLIFTWLRHNVKVSLFCAKKPVSGGLLVRLNVIRVVSRIKWANAHEVLVQTRTYGRHWYTLPAYSSGPGRNQMAHSNQIIPGGFN